jgi:hypothetical protein
MNEQYITEELLHLSGDYDIIRLYMQGYYADSFITNNL